MRAVYLNEKEIKEIEFTDSLDEMYRLIDCRCIDIIQRKIGGKYYTIVVDDEGLFKELPRPSAIGDEGDVMLVGNLIITSGAHGEHLKGITTKDVDNIIDNAFMAYNLKTNTSFPVIKMSY